MIKGTDLFFPDPNCSHPNINAGGIELRTWIATQALQGLLSNPNLKQNLLGEIVDNAVDCADVLIDRLNKPVNVAP